MMMKCPKFKTPWCSGCYHEFDHVENKDCGVNNSGYACSICEPVEKGDGKIDETEKK
jgi:hypothetical protein